jgi:hypothetical protein
MRSSRNPMTCWPQLAAVALVLPLLLGAGDAPQEAVEQPDYFPLAVGHRWDYRATYRMATGNTVNATASLTIEGLEIIAGQEYYKAVIRTSGVLGDPVTTKYYRRTATAIVEAGGTKAAGDITLLPVPLRNGDKWTTVLPDELFFGKVTSRQEATVGWKVPVENQTFPNCAKIASTVETRLGSMKHDQWLAPGVGIVRQKQTCPLWSMESVLTEFRPGR